MFQCQLKQILKHLPAYEHTAALHITYVPDYVLTLAAKMLKQNLPQAIRLPEELDAEQHQLLNDIMSPDNFHWAPATNTVTQCQTPETIQNSYSRGSYHSRKMSLIQQHHSRSALSHRH